MNQFIGKVSGNQRIGMTGGWIGGSPGGGSGCPMSDSVSEHSEHCSIFVVLAQDSAS